MIHHYNCFVLSLHFVFVSKLTDEDECVSNVNLCGNYSTCTNTQGSFKCQCLDGYKDTGGKVTFAGDGQCKGKHLLVNVCDQ